MRESIRGYTDAVVEDAAAAGEIGSLADQLASVGDLIRGNTDLRLVLGDPGLAAHVRRSVVTDLFGGQVSAAGVGLLSHIIDVDRPTEFSEDLAWLVRRVDAARDGLVAFGEGPLGRTAATERLDGYATAILTAVRADDALGDVEDDLFRFSRVVDGTEALQQALTDPSTPAPARAGLVHDLLADKAQAASTRLAGYAVTVGRPRDYVALLAALVERVAEESQRRVAEVRAPIDLTEEQSGRLGAALSRMIGHDVDIRVIVDRSVLGGFVATIGDSVVDGSVRHRLDQLRERLVLPEANVTT